MVNAAEMEVKGNRLKVAPSTPAFAVSCPASGVWPASLPMNESRLPTCSPARLVAMCLPVQRKKEMGSAMYERQTGQFRENED